MLSATEALPLCGLPTTRIWNSFSPCPTFCTTTSRSSLLSSAARMSATGVD